MNKKITAFAMSAVMAFSGFASLGTVVSAAEAPVNITIAASKVSGWKTVDGDKYYYGKDGEPLTGWKKIGGETYYFGKDGVMRTGWVKLSGSTYYFGRDGKMRTGKISINGKTYNFGSDGKLSTGKSKTKTAKKGKTSVSWGESSASVEKKLQGMNYFALGPIIIVFNGNIDFSNYDASKTALDATFYMFDEDDALQMYGTVKEGNSVSSQVTSLKNSGYKTLASTVIEGSTAYFLKKGSTTVMVMSAEEEGKRYTVCMYLSPEMSADMLAGDTSEIQGIFGSLGV